MAIHNHTRFHQILRRAMVGALLCSTTMVTTADAGQPSPFEEEVSNILNTAQIPTGQNGPTELIIQTRGLADADALRLMQMLKPGGELSDVKTLGLERLDSYTLGALTEIAKGLPYTNVEKVFCALPMKNVLRISLLETLNHCLKNAPIVNTPYQFLIPWQEVGPLEQKQFLSVIPVQEAQPILPFAQKVQAASFLFPSNQIGDALTTPWPYLQTVAFPCFGSLIEADNLVELNPPDTVLNMLKQFPNLKELQLIDGQSSQITESLAGDAPVHDGLSPQFAPSFKTLLQKLPARIESLKLNGVTGMFPRYAIISEALKIFEQDGIPKTLKNLGLVVDINEVKRWVSVLNPSNLQQVTLLNASNAKDVEALLKEGGLTIPIVLSTE